MPDQLERSLKQVIAQTVIHTWFVLMYLHLLKLSITETLALVTMLAAPAGAQEDAAKPDWAALLAEKADSVVAIKFVIQIKVMVGGQVMQDAEQNQELRGTLVNDKGLVMAANSSFFPKVPPNARFQLEVGQPRDLMILFGNEEKEYDWPSSSRDSSAMTKIAENKDWIILCGRLAIR